MYNSINSGQFKYREVPSSLASIYVCEGITDLCSRWTEPFSVCVLPRATAQGSLWFNDLLCIVLIVPSFSRGSLTCDRMESLPRTTTVLLERRLGVSPNLVRWKRIVRIPSTACLFITINTYYTDLLCKCQVFFSIICQCLLY